MESSEEQDPLNGAINGEVQVSSETVKVQKLPMREYAEKCEEGQVRRSSNPTQEKLVASFENFFYWLGSFTSRKPHIVIALSLILTAIGCAGLPFLQMENNAIKLWIPQESDFSLNYAWLWSNFPPEVRIHSIIIHADDVLTPEVIQQMYKIHKGVFKLKTENNRTWEDTCLRIPVVNIDEMMEKEMGRRKRAAEWVDDFADDFEADLEDSSKSDFSIGQYPEPYCSKVSGLPTSCLQESILELWADNGTFSEKSDEMIRDLTKDDIIEKINKERGWSELYMTERDFKSLLGGIVYDDNDQIINATATKMMWMGKMNATRALAEGGSDVAGTGELVDRDTDLFEDEMTTFFLNDAPQEGIKVEVNVANSFGNIASSTIWGDVNNLIIGFSIVFIYVNFMLGKFNQVEQRGYLSLLGLGSVGMAIGFAYGVCSVMGLQYGPLHNIIPFLLLGIGIDDMFVTMQCFNNLDGDKSKGKIHERMGLTLRHAGCAITVTSLTDFLAFAIGGTTVLPALKSFCIFCAVGLIVVYFLQATWFVAWFSLDQRRMEAGRDATFPCIIHKNFKPNKFSQRNILQSIFRKLSEVVILVPSKAAILCVTVLIFGVSIWGNLLLRQEFNPIWFLPPESFLAQWHKQNAIHFPSQGEKVTVFMENLDLPEDLLKLDKMHDELANQTDIIVSFDSWYLDFKKYMNKYFLTEKGLPDETLTQEEFDDKLTQFLYGPFGARHRMLINFYSEPECGVPSSAMNLSTISFTHRLMDGPTEQIPAMNRVKQILSNANISTRVFPMCVGYASWETDEVISEELYRNIALAVICVFLTTWLLLFNIWVSLQVMSCVLLTLVNVGGFIHFWGLTIDTVSCTNIIIAIGLCVDYSAHIAHAFMSANGSRNDRVKAALSNIGPAVLNGGFSTFLAFVLLAGSRSHVFSVFFKVFFLVVIFGLFNGLLFLPVMLSFIGPPSYGTHAETEKEEKLNNVENKPIIKNGSEMNESRIKSDDINLS